MCEDIQNEDPFGLVVHARDEPVVIAMDVKHVLRPTIRASPKSFRISDREFQFALRVILYQFIKGTNARGCFSKNFRIAGLLITLTSHEVYKM